MPSYSKMAKEGRRDDGQPPRQDEPPDPEWRCPRCGGARWRMSRKGNWVCARCVRRPRHDAPEPTDDAELTGKTTKPTEPALPPEPSPPPSEYSYEYYTEEEAPPPEPKKAKNSAKTTSKTPQASPRERAQAVVDNTRDALARALREAQAAESMFRDHFGDEPGPTGARSSGLRRDADGREIPDNPAPRHRARSPAKAPRTNKRDRSPPEPPRRSEKPPEPREPPRRARPSDEWSEGKGRRRLLVLVGRLGIRVDRPERQGEEQEQD